jgi:hypothetical protein
MLCILLCCIQGVLVFGEKLTLFTLAGGLLIFAGVLLVALRSHQPSSSSKARGSSSADNIISAEDAEAAVPLKASDHHHQQLQQQQHGGDSAHQGVDQGQQYTGIADAHSPGKTTATAGDVELGAVSQHSRGDESEWQECGEAADKQPPHQQQQLQPLLHGFSSSSSTA